LIYFLVFQAILWQHIKGQTLIQKQPSDLEGCFCIYARKVRYYGHFRAFSVFHEFGNTARQRACLWYGGMVSAWKLTFAPPPAFMNKENEETLKSVCRQLLASYPI